MSSSVAVFGVNTTAAPRFYSSSLCSTSASSPTGPDSAAATSSSVEMGSNGN